VDEEGDGDEGEADDGHGGDAGDEIGADHQGQAGADGDEEAGFFAVQEEAHADGAQDQEEGPGWCPWGGGRPGNGVPPV
jgi:hypothetical protein